MPHPTHLSFNDNLISNEIDYSKYNLPQEEIELLEYIRYLYITKNLTSKQVCEILCVKHTSEIQTRMGKCLPKGLGWGGNRR